MAIFLDTPVDITPTTPDAITDEDVSAHVSASTTGLILLCINESTTEDCYHALRPNGSSSFVDFIMPPETQTIRHVGVDGSQIFEYYYVGSGYATPTVYLIGYHEDDAEFLVNLVDIYNGGTSGWNDVDVSSYVSAGAIAAFYDVFHDGSPINRGFGTRKNGSTDTLKTSSIAHIARGGIVGLDSNRVFEMYGDGNSLQSCFLQGAILSDFTWHTNALNRSLGTTGSYQDLTALPSGAIAGAYHIQGASTGYKFALRENGESYDNYHDALLQSLGVSKSDGSQVVEGKIENTAVDFYELGYYEGGAAGPTTYTAEMSSSATVSAGDTRIGDFPRRFSTQATVSVLMDAWRTLLSQLSSSAATSAELEYLLERVAIMSTDAPVSAEINRVLAASRMLSSSADVNSLLDVTTTQGLLAVLSTNAESNSALNSYVQLLRSLSDNADVSALLDSDVVKSFLSEASEDVQVYSALNSYNTLLRSLSSSVSVNSILETLVAESLIAAMSSRAETVAALNSYGEFLRQFDSSAAVEARLAVSILAGFISIVSTDVSISSDQQIIAQYIREQTSDIGVNATLRSLRDMLRRMQTSVTVSSSLAIELITGAIAVLESNINVYSDYLQKVEFERAISTSAALSSLLQTLKEMLRESSTSVDINASLVTSLIAGFLSSLSSIVDVSSNSEKLVEFSRELGLTLGIDAAIYIKKLLSQEYSTSVNVNATLISAVEQLLAATIRISQAVEKNPTVMSVEVLYND